MMLHEKTKAAGAELDVRRVAGRVGGEIRGLTLGGGLDSETIAAIRQALLKYKVIFFRNQRHFSFAGQEAFAARFGTLEAHPTLGKIEGTEAALKLDYADGATAANEWHSDETYQDAYPLGAVLHAVTIPSVGGDTIWANTVTAYAQLPAPLQELAEKLWVVHSNSFDPEDAVKNREDEPAKFYRVEHPLVRVHPETGERALVLGYHTNHTQKIVGLSNADSARLLGIFQDHVTRPENTVRWHWAAGDVAFWDNRATQHYGIGDFSEARHLHRVSIAGDVPVSVDGRSSVLRSK